MKKYKGTVRIDGKEYPCEVKNGVRYINGMTVDEFYNTLPLDVVLMCTHEE